MYAWMLTGLSLLLALAPAPGAHAAGVSVSVEQSVEAVGLRESGPWPAGVVARARQNETALPLAARTTLRLQWQGSFQWPGSATGAADVSWALRLYPLRGEYDAEATHEAELESARLSWLVPGGVLELGRFAPEWGKGFVHQVSSPLDGMGEAPYAVVLTWAGEKLVTAAGYIRSASSPFEGTGGSYQAVEVPFLRLSAAGSRADGALSAGYRTGQGPWLSAQFARQLASGWQMYGEGILARPYRPVRMERPEASNGWSVLEPPAYAAAAAVRWLAGIWYLSPASWNLIAEYRYEPGGLDDLESATFWQAASGNPASTELPPDTAAQLAEVWSAAVLQKLGGLTQGRLSLCRRYLDWAVRREGPDSDWAWGVAGTFNLDDGSSVWVPEAQRRVTGAVTASFRLVLWQGGASTEYGASPRAWSMQVSLASSLE